jgi:multimeric flavodoxin WrbA
MNTVIMCGSPRKKGNTDILLGEVGRGAASRGHSVRTIDLFDHEIRPCMDCRACKKGDLVCVVDDGMQAVYPHLAEADLIVFGTPVYWWGPSAKMKLMFDRLRPYAASGGLKGKKAVLVTASAGGEANSGLIREMFRLSFEHLGMVPVGEIITKAYEWGEIKNNTAELKRAFDLGASWEG